MRGLSSTQQARAQAALVCVKEPWCHPIHAKPPKSSPGWWLPKGHSCLWSWGGLLRLAGWSALPHALVPQGLTSVRKMSWNGTCESQTCRSRSSDRSSQGLPTDVRERIEAKFGLRGLWGAKVSPPRAMSHQRSPWLAPSVVAAVLSHAPGKLRGGERISALWHLGRLYTSSN